MTTHALGSSKKSMILMRLIIPKLRASILKSLALDSRLEMQLQTRHIYLIKLG